MAKLVLCHVAKLSKIKQMWHLQMICPKFAIEVNPFFRPVFGLKTGIDFAHFGLESDMVYEGATVVCQCVRRFNSKCIIKKV